MAQRCSGRTGGACRALDLAACLQALNRHRLYEAPDVYKRQEDGTIRPLYLYTVDADEFVVNKLLDRGSLSATTMVTNVQDFITIVARGLGIMD